VKALISDVHLQKKCAITIIRTVERNKGKNASLDKANKKDTTDANKGS
jgi:hypothetical protein